MTLRRVTVECYAGSRADERPRKIQIRGREHVVATLLCESVEESLATKERTRHYKILTDDGLILSVVRKDDGAWFLDSERSD